MQDRSAVSLGLRLWTIKYATVVWLRIKGGVRWFWCSSVFLVSFRSGGRQASNPSAGRAGNEVYLTLLPPTRHISLQSNDILHHAGNTVTMESLVALARICVARSYPADTVRPLASRALPSSDSQTDLM